MMHVHQIPGRPVRPQAVNRHAQEIRNDQRPQLRIGQETEGVFGFFANSFYRGTDQTRGHQPHWNPKQAQDTHCIKCPAPTVLISEEDRDAGRQARAQTETQLSHSGTNGAFFGQQIKTDSFPHGGNATCFGHT